MNCCTDHYFVLKSIIMFEEASRIITMWQKVSIYKDCLIGGFMLKNRRFISQSLGHFFWNKF